MARQVTMNRMAANQYTIGFIGLFSFVAAILLSLFMARDISGTNWSLWIVMLIMTIVGFMFTAIVANVFDMNVGRIPFALLYGGFTFAIAILIQVPIMLALHSSYEYSAFKLLAPVSEEYFFRGFLFRVFDLAGSWVAGVVVSAPAFAVFHAYVYNLMQPAIMAVLVGAGVVYAVFYKLTRMIDVPIIAHIANNVVAP